MKRYFLYISLIMLSLIPSSLSFCYTSPKIPLMGAARLGSHKLVYTSLVCKHENPNQHDELGNTPLHYAIHIESREVTNELLKHHANPNAQNNKGKTPLHIAIQQNNDYLARRLMVYGANPNIADNNGNTPLHSAALLNDQSHSYQMVCDLIAYGANPCIENNKHQTPLSLAQRVYVCNYTMHAAFKQRKNAQQILTLLKEKPCLQKPLTPLDKQFVHLAKSTHTDAFKKTCTYDSININQPYGKYQRTALIYAAKQNRTNIVSYLVKETNADKTIQDLLGKTALDYAKKHKNEKIIALLTS